MTTKTIVAFFAAVLVGFAAGWLAKPQAQAGTEAGVTTAAAAAAQATAAQAATTPRQQATAQADTIEALRQELSATRADYAALEKQAAQATAKAQRYDYIHNQVQHRGDGIIFLSFNRDNLEPSEALSGFLGLNEADSARLSQIGQQTLEQIKDWESKNRILLEADEDNRIIELPPFPQDIQAQYRAQLGSLLPAQDADLVNTLAGKTVFAGARFTRRLTITLSVQNDREMVTTKVENLDAQGRAGSSSSSTSSISNDPFPVNTRWQHLYRIRENAQ